MATYHGTPAYEELAASFEKAARTMGAKVSFASGGGAIAPGERGEAAPTLTVFKQLSRV